MIRALTTQSTVAIHPNRMTALPENRAPVIGHPGQGEMQIIAALVDLQLQISLGAPLAADIAHLQGQATIKTVLTQ
jgi:hypothetical protein